MSLETPVSHIYDRSVQGVVVGHDTDEKGNYHSGLVLVRWNEFTPPGYCISDELISLEPPRERPRYRRHEG